MNAATDLTLSAALRILREGTPAQLAEFYDGTWMYAIQADGYGGDIKLGISRDPIARLRTLQVGTSMELYGIAAWPALPALEAEIHEAFATSRIRGEWFMHSLPLWRLVRALGGGFRWQR